jgi:hypothetical protein
MTLVDGTMCAWALACGAVHEYEWANAAAFVLRTICCMALYTRQVSVLGSAKTLARNDSGSLARILEMTS